MFTKYLGNFKLIFLDLKKFNKHWFCNGDLLILATKAGYNVRGVEIMELVNNSGDMCYIKYIRFLKLKNRYKQKFMLFFD